MLPKSFIWYLVSNNSTVLERKKNELSLKTNEKKLHTKFKGHRSVGSGEEVFKKFLLYRHGGHFVHVTKPSCIIVLFYYSQKLSHDIWCQITQQGLRKARFKFANVKE